MGRVRHTTPAATVTPQSVPSGNATNCKTYAAFGLRGSSEDPQGDFGLFTGWTRPTFTDASPGFGKNDTKVADSFDKFTGTTLKRIPVQYQALPVPIADPRVSPADFTSSIYEGADKLVARAYQEEKDCPDEKSLIIAYSQGALAAHIAFRALSASQSTLLNKFVGIAFVSDPGRVFNPKEEWWRSASLDGNNQLTVYTPTVAQSLSVGVWSAAMLFAPGVSGPLPDDIAGRTVELCHSRDPVCSAYVGTWFTEHLNYTDGELDALGYMLYQKVSGF